MGDGHAGLSADPGKRPKTGNRGDETEGKSHKRHKPSHGAADGIFGVPSLRLRKENSGSRRSKDNIPNIDLTIDDDDGFDEHHDVSQSKNSTQTQTAVGSPEALASETQDQPTELKMPLELPYDICLGVIEIKASMSSQKESKLDNTPMEVRLSNKSLGIFDASSKQIGAIISPTLSELIKEFSVTLIAYNQHGRNSNDETYPTRSMYHRRGLRIVIYGMSAEKEDVSSLLSRGKMFLQHPVPAEYDSRVPYDNPQFFVRPGGSMPKVEDLYVASQNRRTRVVKEALTEVEKAHLLQIFESASDPNVAANISQSSRLSSSLKEHHRSALAMMVEKECGILERTRFPSIWKVEDDDSGKKRFRNAVTNMLETKPVPVRGGILADEMGLGKTLSVLALLCWHLDTLHDTATGVSKRTTLLVTPKSIIHEWKQQIRAHTKPNSIEYAVYHGANRKLSVGEWDKKDIVLTTYDTLRSDYASNSPLFRTTWARVVLDEAHNIRNGSSQIFNATTAVKAPRRWCITGTPIQNCLDDFGSLLSFIGVPPFQSQDRFRFWITQPVAMKHHYAFTTLRKLVAATCLRRTKALTVGTLRLAAKTELEEVLDFNERDRALHEFFKSRALSLASNKSDTPISQIIAPKTGNMLILIGILRLICNHGESLLSPAALMAWRESDPASVDWKMISVATRRCESCSADMEDIPNPEPATKEFSCGHAICADCESIEEKDSLLPDQSICIRCTQSGHRSPNYALASPQREKPPSAKVNALIQNLRHEQAIVPCDAPNKPTKSVVFTYWTKMLDLIQNALEANAMVFERIDGRTTLSRRIQALDRFNSDPDCRIMLATIGSVGEGVNLTIASFVHIMEPQWNPMTEAQAVDRVHRIGQTRDVIIRRYTIRKSIESVSKEDYRENKLHHHQRNLYDETDSGHQYVKWVQDHKLKLIQQSLSESETSQSAVDEKRWKVLLKSLGGDGLA